MPCRAIYAALTPFSADARDTGFTAVTTIAQETHIHEDSISFRSEYSPPEQEAQDCEGYTDWSVLLE